MAYQPFDQPETNETILKWISLKDIQKGFVIIVLKVPIVTNFCQNIARVDEKVSKILSHLQKMFKYDISTQ